MLNKFKSRLRLNETIMHERWEIGRRMNGEADGFTWEGWGGNSCWLCGLGNVGARGVYGMFGRL